MRRLPKRGVYERGVVCSLLDEGLVCHIGLVADGKPVVIPPATVAWVTCFTSTAQGPVVSGGTLNAALQLFEHPPESGQRFFYVTLIVNNGDVHPSIRNQNDAFLHCQSQESLQTLGVIA